MNHVRGTLLSNKWLIREKWNTQILSIFAEDLDTSASTVVPLIIYRTFDFNTREKSKLHPDQALLLAQICFMITLRIITWRERERDLTCPFCPIRGPLESIMVCLLSVDR